MLEAVIAGLVAGIAAGTVVVLLERFLFEPKESAKSLRRTTRLVRVSITGDQGLRCPACAAADPQLLDTWTGNQLVEGGTATKLIYVEKYKCKECSSEWGEEQFTTIVRQ